MSVHGVVLAAGLGRRMGQPKALLEVGDSTFLARAMRSLQAAGCAVVHVVVLEPESDIAEAAAALGGNVIVNPRQYSEQIDSVRLAIRALPEDADALLIMPVDVPLVSEKTVRAVVDAYRRAPHPLVLPFHSGVAGHPVLLDRALFEEVLTRRFGEGVRSLILENARSLLEVKVVDPGILIDIDTPEDYWQFVQQK